MTSQEETELPGPSPRELFADHLRLLFIDAGEPTLEAVSAEVAQLAARRPEFRAARPPRIDRLSAWRLGRNVPDWDQLHPLLVVLIGRARARTPRPDRPERYDYAWWQELWQHARRRGTAKPAAPTAEASAGPATDGPATDGRAGERGSVAGAATAVPAAPPVEPPYRGLEAFRAEDEPYFHGRGEATTALVGLLFGTMVTGGICMLTATSGAGKSSLIHAGLIPRLKADALPGSSSWPVAVLTPGEEPMASLARAVPTLGAVIETPAAELTDEDQAERLRATIREFTGPEARLVILVDQAEELFTACDSPEQRERFVEVLNAVSTAPPGTDPAPALVLVSLRADFIAPCLDDPGLGPLAEAFIHRQYVLQPMKPGELREAIIAPARRAGLKVQPELVEHVMREVGARRPGRTRAGRADPGLLPLLSHALRETYQHRKPGGQLTLDTYLRAGGIEQAVARTADRTWGSLSSEEQAAALRLLLRMTRIGRDTQDTRRRCEKSQLLGEAHNPRAAERALETLADARLITVDSDDVQITHEALLNAWPRLREAIDADRAGHLLRQDLEEHASGWDASGRASDHLWRGTRLAATREWAASHQHELSPTAAQFLAASLDADRRARKMRRAVVGALATGLVLALVATVLAIWQSGVARRERDNAIWSQLSAEADQLRATDASLAAQLHLTAYRAKPTPDLYTDLITAQSTGLSAVLHPGGDGVNSAVFSPDGRTLATTHDDHTVRLWNVVDPTHPTPIGAPLTGHQDSVILPLFTPDGRTLIAGGSDGTVRLWDVTDPAHAAPLSELVGHHDTVYTVAVTSDGRTVASASGDDQVRLWDISDRAHPRQLGAPLTGFAEDVNHVTFSPDRRTLAACSDDGTILLWDVTDPAHPTRLGPPLTDHTGGVVALAFSPDGQTLASSSGDQTARLWRVTDRSHPALLSTIPAHTGPVNSVVWSPDGRRIATGSADQTLKIWNVADPAHPTLLSTLTGHTGIVFVVRWSPDGRTLVSTANDDTVRLWRVPQALVGHTDSVNAVAFSPNSRLLASAGGDGTARLWDTTDPQRPAALGQLLGHTGAIKSVVFGPDGRTVATGGEDSTVRLWNVTDPTQPTPLGPPLSGHAGAITALAFSPTGKTLASASADNQVRLWSTSAGLGAAPTSVTLATGTPGNSDMRCNGPGQWPVEPAAALAFSPDGQFLACSSSDQTAMIWDVRDAAHPTPASPPITGHTRKIVAMAYSPDGRTLASASEDQVVVLVDVSDPAHPRQLSSLTDTNSVRSLAWSADGQTLATAGHDHNIRLWNLTDRTHPAPLGNPITGHTDALDAVAFSPDGRSLASAGDDHTIRLWAIPTQDVIQRICAATVFTPEDWDKYVPSAWPYSPPCD